MWNVTSLTSIFLTVLSCFTLSWSQLSKGSEVHSHQSFGSYKMQFVTEWSKVNRQRESLSVNPTTSGFSCFPHFWFRFRQINVVRVLGHLVFFSDRFSNHVSNNNAIWRCLVIQRNNWLFSVSAMEIVCYLWTSWLPGGRWMPNQPAL